MKSFNTKKIVIGFTIIALVDLWSHWISMFQMMEIGKMSQHNQLNWSDFLLCIGMELAFFKNGERPIQEQMICEKIESLGGKL